MSRINALALSTGFAPGFGLRMARIARHLAVRGFRLRRSATGWRIEVRNGKPAAPRCRP